MPRFFASGVCQFHVLIVYADAVPPTQFQMEILAESNVTAVDRLRCLAATPTLGQLQQYDIVVPFGDTDVYRRRRCLATTWRTTWTEAG